MSTRATNGNISMKRRRHKLQHMTFEQRARIRKSYMANIPRWRLPAVGYIVAVPVVGLAVYGFNSLKSMHDATGLPYYFPDSLMVLPVLFIALFWGMGPALFALLLGTLTLDYIFIPSSSQGTIDISPAAIQLLPFLISGVIIAIIIGQRERARLNALAAEQELQSYAAYLEDANQKLEDANQTKDRFISIASHELKTPITTIRGQAQITLRRLLKQSALSANEEAIRAALEKINDQTRRLALLIDDLLDASSIRAGKIDLYKTQCDVKAICSEVIEDQRLLTGRQIVLDVPLAPVLIQADHDRLSQVAVNLINNATKYSPEKYPVEVSVCQDDHHVLIKAHDYGKGIAKDQVERIFDPFYRTPDAEASAKRGLGLGLAICKEIVERHNGRIWCESEKGKGSTFFVELPLH